MTRVGVIVQIRIRFYRQSLISEPDDNLLKVEDVRSQPEVYIILTPLFADIVPEWKSTCVTNIYAKFCILKHGRLMPL